MVGLGWEAGGQGLGGAGSGCSMAGQGRAGWVLVRDGVGPHRGEHTPRPDELLQHGGHLLRAHVAQATMVMAGIAEGLVQATYNPERPGYVAGPPAQGASPTPRAPREQLLPAAWVPKRPSQGLLPIQLGSLLGHLRPLSFPRPPPIALFPLPSWFFPKNIFVSYPPGWEAPPPGRRPVAQAWCPPVFSSSVLGVLDLV